MIEDKGDRLFKHLKSGKYYWVINSTTMVRESDLEPVVAYTRVNRSNEKMDDVIWIRPKKEFFDGRFKVIKLKE